MKFIQFLILQTIVFSFYIYYPLLLPHLPPSISHSLSATSSALQPLMQVMQLSPAFPPPSFEPSSLVLKGHKGKNWCIWGFNYHTEDSTTMKDEKKKEKEKEKKSSEAFVLKVYDMKNITAEVLYREHAVLSQPALIKGAALHWAAVSKWKSDDYLIEKMGRNRVKIEQSDDNVFRYLDEGNNNWITFSLFLKKLNQTQGETQDLDKKYYVENQDLEEVKSVVKQKRVYAAGISNFEPLMDDIEPFEFTSSLSFHEMGMWMGNGGQVTPLHYDTVENVMAVVSGKKIFTLFEPSTSPNLYPIFSKNQYYSAVDILRPDLESFPRFSQVRSIQVVLEAGDAIFVPAYWWHHVQSYERNIAVNFFYHPHSLLLHNILSTLKDCYPSSAEAYKHGFTSPCVC